MFKLLIECSKDISEIHINFTDGTSVVKSPESLELQNSKPKKPKFAEAREELLDLDYDNCSGSFSETVKKPDIVNPIRKAKVASELQNLDI